MNDIANELVQRIRSAQTAAQVAHEAVQRHGRGFAVARQVIVHFGNGVNARFGRIQDALEFRVRTTATLHREEAGHERQTVLDAVIDLRHEHPLVVERPLERGFVAMEAFFQTLPLDRNAKEVGKSLQKVRIGIVELPKMRAVDLEHAEGRFVASNEHVGCAQHTVLDEQTRCAKTSFRSQLVGNDGLTRSIGIARRTLGAGTKQRVSDDTGQPAHARDDQEIVVRRTVFEDFA
ncbi:MAG TPA: hypothetical protein VFB32_07280 [Rudaea sp.]|nr:hypothetical protein [Rudaea sp.]